MGAFNNNEYLNLLYEKRRFSHNKSACNCECNNLQSIKCTICRFIGWSIQNNEIDFLCISTNPSIYLKFQLDFMEMYTFNGKHTVPNTVTSDDLNIHLHLIIISGNENAFQNFGFCLCLLHSPLALAFWLSKNFFSFVYRFFSSPNYWKWRWVCFFLSKHRCGFYVSSLLIVSIWTDSHNGKWWIVKISRIHWWRYYDRIFIVT